MYDKPIKSLNISQCWLMVNRADTREKLFIAEKWLLEANISNEEYDELMNALAFKSREMYHNS